MDTELIIRSCDCITLFICSAFLACFIYYCIKIMTRHNYRIITASPLYPPGPRRFPVMGSLEMLTHKNVFKVFSLLRSKYGDIFSVTFGKSRMVVLNDFRHVKEAFHLKELNGKPMGSHGHGEEEWSEPRCFLIKSLHRLGFGSPSMESDFQVEIRDLLQFFHRNDGKPVLPHDRIRLATVNPVWNICTGTKWTENDPEFMKLKIFILAVTKSCKIFLKGHAFPWITKLFLKNDYKDYLKNKLEIRKVLKEIIGRNDQLKTNKKENLIDLYMRRMLDSEDNGSCFYKNAGESTLMFALEDLLLGGTEATSVVLMWAFIFLTKYPAVQSQIYDEIVKIIGSRNYPSLSDRKLMPYTEAVIMEVMRFCGLNPLTHHKATMDIVFHGYRIKKGTIVIANYTEIFKDPLVWGDPENFRPERFLNDDLMSLASRHEAFLMFSVGKRACPAENFSRDQIFIYLTSICKHFEVCSTPGDPVSTREAFSGVFRYPQESPIIFRGRPTLK